MHLMWGKVYVRVTGLQKEKRCALNNGMHEDLITFYDDRLLKPLNKTTTKVEAEHRAICFCTMELNF